MNEPITSDAAPPRLELQGITKQFPGVLANDRVTFAVKPGEIHALLGENGAGKSTLVKMIYGIMAPDSGAMRFDGEVMENTSPRAARRRGIGMVFQHFSLFEALSVLENIALGLDEKLSHQRLEARIREVLDQYGLTLDPHRIVSTLSVGERQRIEIVRALLLNPRLLIMDEPTSVLTPQEVEALFEVLRQLAAEGCSILYISHKLDEIKALCQTATILRGGQVVGECDPRQETKRSMAEKMIGAGLRDVDKDRNRSFGEPRLVVKGLSTRAEDEFGVAITDIGFTVRAGEFFGVAGVAGNGQNALVEALSGEVAGTSAEAIMLNGEPIGLLSPSARRRAGLCTVPEERNGHAAISDFTLSDNTVLTARDRMHLAGGGLLRPAAARDYAARVIGEFSVKALGPGAVAGALSGGNLQKFIMGREILQRPDVLVVSQPTWGVDAGAAAAIHRALVELAAAGSAVVLISQDLDELLALSDTLAVINLGRLSDPRPVSEFSIEEIGLLMGGVHGDPEATREMTEVLHAHQA
ncbi:ABC transporter ATP-binding protein [Cucumibacter marinus]|uniref:ABC transporter ATP-binding protein n=1 Tax=Cucumibacter marinus TaxID=1121252 RepID=UPI000425F989|nr:ABC transporter ATP-binding protein [Cucumibacter marinus]